MDNIADIISRDIAKNGVDDEYGSCYNMPSDVVARMTILKNELEKISKLVHAADWLYSGDTGPETFCKEFDEIYNGWK